MPIKVEQFDSEGDERRDKALKEIAKAKAKESGAKNKRIRSILAKIEAELVKGKSITITEEMRLLGIHGKVSGMVFNHSNRLRMARNLGLDGDDEFRKQSITLNLRDSLE